MYIEKLASQIKNDIISGLKGYHQNFSINMKLLEDEVVQTRLLLIKTLLSQGAIDSKDILLAINCIDVDCKDLERCGCAKISCTTPTAHFLIPLIISDLGSKAIDYIGPIDRLFRFNIVHSLTELLLKQYRKRGNNKPYVWIDYAPNENGMLDCFIFNCPLIKTISIVGAFKDPRQLNRYNCCSESQYSLTGADDNVSFLNLLIKDKIVLDKVRYYRQLASPNLPNNQTYLTGN